MPAKAPMDENVRFLYSCLIRSDYHYIDFHLVAADFAINPAAARMRWSRLRKNIALNSSFKDDPNLPLTRTGGRGQKGKDNDGEGKKRKRIAPSSANKKAKLGGEEVADDQEISWLKTEFKTEELEELGGVGGGVGGGGGGGALGLFADIGHGQVEREEAFPLLTPHDHTRSASLEPMARRYELGGGGRFAASMPPELARTPPVQLGMGLFAASPPPTSSFQPVSVMDGLVATQLSVLDGITEHDEHDGHDTSATIHEQAIMHTGESVASVGPNERGEEPTIDDHGQHARTETSSGQQKGPAAAAGGGGDGGSDDLAKPQEDIPIPFNHHEMTAAVPAILTGAHIGTADPWVKSQDLDVVVVSPTATKSKSPAAASTKKSPVSVIDKDDLELIGSGALISGGGGRLLRSQTAVWKPALKASEMDNEDMEEEELGVILEEEYEDEDGSDGEWVE